MTVTRSMRKGKRNRWDDRFTIASASRTLGVTREHLARVIAGERISPRLLLRYRAIELNHSESRAAADALENLSAKSDDPQFTINKKET